MAAEGLLASFAKLTAAIAIGLPLALWLLQERLLFHPQPLSAAQRGEIQRRHATVEPVTRSAADGTQLHAWLVRPPAGAPPAALVLYFGGNAEEVSWMLSAVGDARAGVTPGAAWLLVDYRGYGGSAGSPSEAHLVGDALAWFDFAVALPGIDAQRVHGFGVSLGSGVVVQLAAARPLAGAVLIAPYDSITALAQHYYPYLPVRWLLRHPFDSLSLAAGLRLPLLCLIAERDEVIPPAHGERLCEAWGGPKKKILLKGARHNDIDLGPFWPAVREFLRPER